MNFCPDFAHLLTSLGEIRHRRSPPKTVEHFVSFYSSAGHIIEYIDSVYMDDNIYKITYVITLEFLT
jgi:hypothetical protein